MRPDSSERGTVGVDGVGLGVGDSIVEAAATWDGAGVELLVQAASPRPAATALATATRRPRRDVEGTGSTRLIIGEPTRSDRQAEALRRVVVDLERPRQWRGAGEPQPTHQSTAADDQRGADGVVVEPARQNDPAAGDGEP